MSGRKIVDNQRSPQDGEFHYIDGIAETTERALHDANILTFVQLASISLDEIAKALPGQKGVKERAAHFQWQEKAANFAQMFAENNLNGWPYVTFTIRFVIDKYRVVRRTELSWSGNENKRQFSEWDPNGWIEWISAQAKFNQDSPSGDHQPPPTGSRTQPDGFLKIKKIQIINPESKKPQNSLREHSPFIIGVDLDLSGLKLHVDSLVEYWGTVQLSKLSGWKPSDCGFFKGSLSTNSSIIYTDILSGLLPGQYHLQIVMNMSPLGSNRTDHKGLHAISDGILVRVFASDE